MNPTDLPKLTIELAIVLLILIIAFIFWYAIKRATENKSTRLDPKKIIKMYQDGTFKKSKKKKIRFYTKLNTEVSLIPRENLSNDSILDFSRLILLHFIKMVCKYDKKPELVDASYIPVFFKDEIKFLHNQFGLNVKEDDDRGNFLEISKKYFEENEQIIPLDILEKILTKFFLK